MMLVLTIILTMLVLLARVRETWCAHVGPKKKKKKGTQPRCQCRQSLTGSCANVLLKQKNDGPHYSQSTRPRTLAHLTLNDGNYFYNSY